MDVADHFPLALVATFQKANIDDFSQVLVTAIARRIVISLSTDL